MSKDRIERKEADAILDRMFGAITGDTFAVVKACKHEHHRESAARVGSVTFHIQNKGDDSECWGCFSERMSDGYHTALERIWALLAPIACEKLERLQSDSAKEVSITEMLARAHMAFELAEEMMFGGEGSALDKVLIADEKEASKRAKRLDAPIRKLLEGGARLKSSQSFTGKLGILERYRALRAKIEALLDQQAADAEALDNEADQDP